MEKLKIPACIGKNIISSKLFSLFFLCSALSMVKSVQSMLVELGSCCLLAVVSLGTARNTWTLQVVGTGRLSK